MNDRPPDEPSERAALFQSLVQHSLDVIAVLDDQGTILYGSPALQAILGYPPDQMVGRNARDYLHPDDCAGAGSAGARLLRQPGEPVILEVRLRHAGQHWVAMEAVGQNLLDHAEVRGFLINARVVGPHRQADKDLHLLKAAVESSEDVILIAEAGRLDPFDARVIYANPAFQVMTGYERHEVIGRKLSLLFGPRTSKTDLELAAGQLRRGQSCRTQWLQYRKDGSEFWAESNVQRFPRSVTEPEYLVVIQRDVTEWKQAEEDSKRSEAQFRAVFDHASDALAIFNASGRYLEVNPAACGLLGLSAEEIVGKSLPDFVDPSQKDAALLLWQALRVTGEQRGQLRLVRSDGSFREVEYSAKGHYLPGRHLTIFRDVTERKQLEAQLRQSQKMEAIGKLAGGISHDFNNLLTVINGYSEVLLANAKGDHPLRREIEEIRKAGQRATGLTRQLLAFSRKQILTPKVLDLNTVVASMTKMLRRLIGEHIELTFNPAPNLGKVKADPSQIEQVILNLVLNSRDSMPAGGRLLLATGNLRLQDNSILPQVDVKAGSYVVLSVIDSGNGMDDETLSHIFEPFFTTKEQGKGTGLGLSTVYGIVKQSGGYITAASKPTQGTSMRVYLPQVEAEASTDEVSETAGASTTGSETILLVEDEDVVRTLAASILTKNGYQVLESRGPEEALRIAHLRERPIHLLLTDVVMPVMSGRELAVRLVAARPDMRVLYMSGYTDEIMFQHGVLTPGTAFLPKPFTPHTLSSKVREVLGSGNRAEATPECV
ncbi:MAG: PAS domain S-box protein [Acidobacteriota bacterium]